MKYFLVICALISCVLSAPSPQSDDATQSTETTDAPNQGSNNGVQVVRYFFENNGSDGYRFTLVFNWIHPLIKCY